MTRYRYLLPTAALAAAGLAVGSPAVGQEPAGTLVVVNKGPSTVSIVDVGSGALLGRFPTGEGPHEVVLTSDGATAIVTDYGARSGGNTLTVIDVAGLAVARTIDLGRHQRPHGIAVMPGDEVVAVTSEVSDHVVLIRIATGEIVAEIPTGHPASHMLAMPTDGRAIYTSNMQDGTVSVLDVEGRSHEMTLRVPPTPEAIGAAPDGSEVWVGSNDRGSITAFRTSPWSEGEEVLTGFGWPYRILFTPDLRRVLIPDLRGDRLRIVDRASRAELAALNFPGGGPQGITVTPDSRFAFQSLSAEGRVVVIDLASHEVVGSLDVGARPDGVAYTSRTVSASPR